MAPVVEIYADNGISGSKGRDKRLAFDALHKDAARRKFDLIAASGSRYATPTRRAASACVRWRSALT